MSTETNSVIVAARVDPGFAAQVKRVAEAEDRSVGSLLRRALTHELERAGTGTRQAA